MHEFLVFVLFYVINLSAIAIHSHYKTWKAARAKRELEASTLDAISPLHTDPKPCTGPACKRHIAAACLAAVAHPATAESIHHYVVHFLVYSGQVLK